MGALDDHELAAELASTAGDRLLDLRRRVTDSAARREDGDRTSHELLIDELARRRPDDFVLSEESLSRHDGSAHRIWIIDPLDGTREFGEGRDDWAVHVALVERQAVVAAAVALPALGITLSTPTVEPPARLDTRLRLVVSRTRPPKEAVDVAAALGADLLEMGSAGAKAMAVVRGEADVYLHAGGQYEWDSAAPTGVAAAAGLHVSRADGSPLVYGAQNPWLPDVLICPTQLASQVIAAFVDVTGR